MKVPVPCAVCSTTPQLSVWSECAGHGIYIHHHYVRCPLCDIYVEADDFDFPVNAFQTSIDRWNNLMQKVLEKKG